MQSKARWSFNDDVEWIIREENKTRSICIFKKITSWRLLKKLASSSLWRKWNWKKTTISSFRNPITKHCTEWMTYKWNKRQNRLHRPIKLAVLLQLQHLTQVILGTITLKSTLFPDNKFAYKSVRPNAGR